jgi:hypothetical protein
MTYFKTWFESILEEVRLWSENYAMCRVDVLTTDDGKVRVWFDFFIAARFPCIKSGAVSGVFG